MKFILATTNQGKAKEILAFFGFQHEVKTLTDIGFSNKIVEDGKTFEENALIKARAIHNWLKTDKKSASPTLSVANLINYDYILADDSGLEVDALNGEPGVNTADWMGTDTPYEYKTSKMLELLKDEPLRSARFVSVIVAISQSGEVHTVRSTLEGSISLEKAGQGGFGYDPIFFVPQLGKNLAELEVKEKNKISHRAKSLKLICEKMGVKLNE